MDIQKFFVEMANMVDSEIDAAVAAIEAEGILVKARFRAAVKKAGDEVRRLKMALGMEVNPVAALAVETVGLLSDAEIVNAFFSLNDDAQSDLVVGLEEMGTRGPRILELIQAKIDADAAQAEAEARAKAEEEEKAEAARVRAYELAHPEVLIQAGMPIDDAVALSYIEAQPNGFFRSVAELKALEKDVDGTIMVKSMYSGVLIPTTEAKILRLCFVCEEAIANRLRKQLGGKSERYHHWDESQRWIAEREAAAAEKQAAQDALTAEVTAVLSESAAHVDGSTVWDHVSLARAMDKLLSDKAEAGLPIEEGSWQERIVFKVYDEFTEKARFVFVGRLREQFRTVEETLEGFIAEKQDAVADAKSAGEPELVRRAYIAQLRCALTHKDWLAAHPPRQQQIQKTFDSAARPVVRHTGKTARSKANGEDPEAKKTAKREADRAYREAHKGKGGGGDTRRGQPKKGKGSNKNAA